MVFAIAAGWCLAAGVWGLPTLVLSGIDTEFLRSISSVITVCSPLLSSPSPPLFAPKCPAHNADSPKTSKSAPQQFSIQVGVPSAQGVNMSIHLFAASPLYNGSSSSILWFGLKWLKAGAKKSPSWLIYSNHPVRVNTGRRRRGAERESFLLYCCNLPPVKVLLLPFTPLLLLIDSPASRCQTRWH